MASVILHLFVGLGIMPLQLLNLGVIIPRMIYLLFVTRTPRGS
jgi:calcium permeable stress-gated cation channel